MIVYYFREDGVYLKQGEVAGPGWSPDSTPTSPLPIPLGSHAIWSAPEWIYVVGNPPQYPLAETQWAAIRLDRDNRLKETDWVSIRAADTATPMSAEWAAYRQALRDITTQTDPFSIIWPTKP